jgi:hypothetical protein
MTKKAFLFSAISSLLLTIVGLWSTNCYCSTECANPYCETTIGPAAWYEIFEKFGALSFAMSFTAHFAITATVVFSIVIFAKKII